MLYGRALNSKHSRAALVELLTRQSEIASNLRNLRILVDSDIAERKNLIVSRLHLCLVCTFASLIDRRQREKYDAQLLKHSSDDGK